MKNYLFNIKNINHSNLTVYFNVLEQSFLIINNEDDIIKDHYISTFEINHIESNKYELLYKYNSVYKNKYIFSVFF